MTTIAERIWNYVIGNELGTVCYVLLVIVNGLQYIKVGFTKHPTFLWTFLGWQIKGRFAGLFKNIRFLPPGHPIHNAAEAAKNGVPVEDIRVVSLFPQSNLLEAAFQSGNLRHGPLQAAMAAACDANGQHGSFWELRGKKPLSLATARNSEFYPIALAPPSIVMSELVRVATVCGYQGTGPSATLQARSQYGKRLKNRVLNLLRKQVVKTILKKKNSRMLQKILKKNYRKKCRKQCIEKMEKQGIVFDEGKREEIVSNPGLQTLLPVHL